MEADTRVCWYIYSAKEKLVSSTVLAPMTLLYPSANTSAYGVGAVILTFHAYPNGSEQLINHIRFTNIDIK